VLLATGERKREALTRLLRGDPNCLAARLARLHVYTDLNGDRMMTSDTCVTWP
jgi:hypothetical protein